MEPSPINQEQYDLFVSSRIKPGWKIQAEQDSEDCDLSHAAMGIASEAGEIVDCIKKRTIYAQDLNLPHLIEELGDIEFFLSQLRSCVNITRDEILTANIAKLSKRYPNGYTDSDAQVRKDKLS